MKNYIGLLLIICLLSSCSALNNNPKVDETWRLTLTKKCSNPTDAFITKIKANKVYYIIDNFSCVLPVKYFKLQYTRLKNATSADILQRRHLKDGRLPSLYKETKSL